MSNTLNLMELKLVDTLEVQCLEVGDFVKIFGEVVEIEDISSFDNQESWVLIYSNEFGEKNTVTYPYGWVLEFYFYCEDTD